MIWANDDESSIPVTVPSPVTCRELGAESRFARPESLVGNTRAPCFSVLRRQFSARILLQLPSLLAEGLVLAYPGTVVVLSASGPQEHAAERDDASASDEPLSFEAQR